MSRALRINPRLVDDAHEAFSWCENVSTGLGHDFMRALEAAVFAAWRNPLLYRRVFQGFRRILLHRFPYALYFHADNRVVRILLLTHGARNPRHISASVRQRKHEVH